MKLSFYQLFLFLFLILKCSHCQAGSYSNDDENKIYQKLYTATNRTLTSILPPLCSKIILNQNNAQNEYISPKGLIGRIIPGGTFPTRTLALEYLCGILCPIPNLPARLNTVQTFDLVRVTYDNKYLITESEFIFNLASKRRLTFFASMAFDKDYKLCGYEGQIRNLGLILDATTQEERRTNISLICTVAQRFCNGSLQQYASLNACVKFLTNSVPYGSFDRGDQGNVACRVIHTNLVPLLPSVHCPHVGPTGGGTCTDKTLNFYYNQPNFLACAQKYN